MKVSAWMFQKAFQPAQILWPFQYLLSFIICYCLTSFLLLVVPKIVRCFSFRSIGLTLNFRSARPKPATETFCPRNLSFRKTQHLIITFSGFEWIVQFVTMSTHLLSWIVTNCSQSKRRKISDEIKWFKSFILKVITFSLIIFDGSFCMMSSI